MANNRLDFSTATKKVIAARAGYRCSFPGCNAQLVAPNGDSFIELGECAHIYAAAQDGPRGVTHLSNEAIVSPDNGIYLCQAHHKLIDSAEGCKLYPAEELLRIKQRHEYKNCVGGRYSVTAFHAYSFSETAQVSTIRSR